MPDPTTMRMTLADIDPCEMCRHVFSVIVRCFSPEHKDLALDSRSMPGGSAKKNLATGIRATTAVQFDETRKRGYDKA